MEPWFLLMLPVVFALGVSPHSDVADSTFCPSANFSSPEGSSKVIAANISAYPKMLVLCKKNHSPGCQDILFINRGQANYLDHAYTGHFYISDNALAFKNASKVLTGYYQLAYYINRSCVQQFSLGILGLWRCSSTNFLLPEGSSKTIIANMSSISQTFDLYKKKNLSSDWQHILSINKRQLNYVRKDYEGHFMISEDGFAMKNATEEVIGEYQLVESGNVSCVQQFFLNVSGSDATDGLTSVTAPTVSVVLCVMLCLGIYLYIYQKRRRRREGNRNEPAVTFTSVPDSENGSLQNGIYNLQGRNG